MSDPSEIVSARNVAPLIRCIRDVRVILDAELAQLYGVETRALNQALKRNQERFPDDFAFELTREEILGISQTVISLHRLKFSKQVRAFTEHGALMAANILNSPRAVAMSVYVIRAFVKMREDLCVSGCFLGEILPSHQPPVMSSRIANRQSQSNRLPGYFEPPALPLPAQTLSRFPHHPAEYDDWTVSFSYIR